MNETKNRNPKNGSVNNGQKGQRRQTQSKNAVQSVVSGTSLYEKKQQPSRQRTQNKAKGGDRINNSPKQRSTDRKKYSQNNYHKNERNCGTLY